MQAFTSLPPEEEQSFVVYEQRMLQTSRSANVIGWGIAAALAALTLIIVISFWGPLPQEGGEPAPGAAPTEPK